MFGFFCLQFPVSHVIGKTYVCGDVHSFLSLNTDSKERSLKSKALYYSPQSLIRLSCITVGSVEPMWPVSKDVELREDIQVLIKFWQAMLSDKKYMKYFMVAAPVDTSQLLTHGSSTGSQYTSGSSGIGPFLQVCITTPNGGSITLVTYLDKGLICRYVKLSLKGVPEHLWIIRLRPFLQLCLTNPNGRSRTLMAYLG